MGHLYPETHMRTERTIFVPVYTEGVCEVRIKSPFLLICADRLCGGGLVSIDPSDHGLHADSGGAIGPVHLVATSVGACATCGTRQQSTVAVVCAYSFLSCTLIGLTLPVSHAHNRMQCSMLVLT